jgi:hypothetical protein
VAEAFDDRAEREIGGAEIVAPLRDAVRFVDDEERRFDRLQQFQESLVFKLLGRRIDDFDGLAGNAFARAYLLVFGKRRVQRDDVRDAALLQHVELIFHQRDQRADDDGRALEQ